MNIASKKIIIDANFPSETRVVLLDSNNNIEEIKNTVATRKQNKGNIYLATITRIEPSLQAIFIEYGNDKSGFLPFIEVHPSYYNVKEKEQKSFLEEWGEISPPTITNDDLKEKHIEIDTINIVGKEEVNIDVIKKLADDKIEQEYELDVAESEIETIEVPQKERESSNKYYKIQDVLKRGQTLLVQLTKEERGNKGASFTTYLSLAGKYCVLMPNKAAHYGISRKILNANERKRLKNIITELAEYTKSASIIARTAAIGHTTLEIKRDYEYLAKLWNQIREASLQAEAPCFIHQEEDIIQKVIRDMCDRYVGEVLIQGSDAYRKATKFINDISPTDSNKIKEYRNKIPIFTKFEVEEQLMKLYQPIVHLTSGGYIVINPTEALISIDVNSGKSTSERNIEDTALKTNLEAAKEITRQIKLRELSGLVVIDFIDMQEMKNRKIVERSFKEFLSFDRAKIQTSIISNFGLLEMSRQRMGSSFLETNTSICAHCNGKGVIRSDESNAMLILRTIENEIFNEGSNISIVNVYANNAAVIYLLNNKRLEIGLIETKYNIKLNFYIDHNATADSYSLEKIKTSKPIHDSNKNLTEPSAKEIRIKPNHKKREQPREAKPQMEPSTLVEKTSVTLEEEVIAKQEVKIETLSQEESFQPTNVAANKKRKYIYRKREKRRPNKNILTEGVHEDQGEKKVSV